MPIEYMDTSTKLMSSRIGKIRLGQKSETAKGKEYPTALPHFRWDPDDADLLPLLHKIYGEKPKKLRIMFVSNDIETIFPQYLCKYGRSQSGKSYLLCKGTGGRLPDGSPKPALFRVNKETGEVLDNHPCDPDTCPDFNAKPYARCKPIASLMFMLPDLPSLRHWQIDTGGWRTSVPHLNTRIRALQNIASAMGRESGVAGIPLVLILKPIEVQPPALKGKKKTIYVMDLELDHEAILSGHRSIALFDALQGGGKIAAPAPDLVEAPEGVFPRRVTDGADPVQERVEMAREAGDVEGIEEAERGFGWDGTTLKVPPEVAEAFRMIGVTQGQAVLLVEAHTKDGQLMKTQLMRYIDQMATRLGDEDLEDILAELAPPVAEAEVVDEDGTEDAAKETGEPKAEPAEEDDPLGI